MSNEENISDPQTTCGFVALVGAPNAGKSTLMNHLVGFKVSIVTPKVQTTRSRIRGICQHEKAQVIFVDTPGIFEPKRRLDRAMVQAAWQGAGDADVVVLLVDAARRKVDADTWRIIEGLKATGRPAILALNKVDLVPREELLPRAAELNDTGVFSDTFMISAESGNGCADLLTHLAGRLPKGPWLYPEDEVSDLPQRLLAAEATREQIFLRLHQELPYAITVETETWKELEDGSARINQVIYVERDGHKGIVLGKGGQQIKTIGMAARQELEKILDRRLHLVLHVKVRSNWMDDPERYREWGLDYKA
jgi:GTP-binding protein Era